MMLSCRRYKTANQVVYLLILLWIIVTGIHAKKNIEPKPAPYDKITKEKVNEQSNKKYKNVKELFPESFKPWIQRDCFQLKKLLNRKSFAVKKIQSSVVRISKDKSLSTIEKKYHIQTFRIFSQELNETESGVLESLQWLDSVLTGDFKNLVNLQEKSLARLNYLKDAVLVEEREYQEVLAAQEGLEKVNKTRVKGLMDQILADVSNAADELEELLSENLFNIAVEDGAAVETVVKLRSGEENEPIKQQDGKPDAEPAENEQIMKLVDSKDNQFVLSKGSDSTVPHEDHHLIKDVVYVFFTAFIFGVLCSALKMPTMFGYILAGVFLGSSMFNVIKSQVQIETLGEFGVFFILFVVGLGFSPSQLKKVFRIAVLGTTCMTLLMVLAGMVVGKLLNSSVNESVFVAACLSLSSTPLVVKFLSPTNPSDTDNTSTTDFGSILLGILIMQDVLLGLIMAFLPILASTTHDTQQTRTDLILSYIILVVQLVVALTVVVFVTFVMAKFVIGRLFDIVLKRFPQEIALIMVVVIAFLMLVLTDSLQISMELGCFLAGVMISAQTSEISQTVEKLVLPLKDFLSVIFFASIGLHVFPTFLAYQLTILTTLTMAIVTGKYIISSVVLGALTRRAPAHIKWIVSAGLSQVSEFSFVLGSRARRLGLISREVYLLILSITTLSLLFAPVLWKVTVWKLRIKPAELPSVDGHSTSPPPLSPQIELPEASPLMRRPKTLFTDA